MDKLKKQPSPIDEAVAHACGPRRCEQCGYVVTDPLVTRCPRCWGAVPAGGCEGCSGCSLHAGR